MTLAEPVDMKPNRAVAVPLARLDRRTRAGKTVKDARRSLFAALGHEPDALEAIYVDTAASLILNLRLLDARIRAANFIAPDQADLYNRLAGQLIATLAALRLPQSTVFKDAAP